MIRVSASVNFQGRVIRVSMRMSRIPADLRPQADASAVRTTVDRRFLKLNVHFDGRKVELTWRGQAEAPSVASCRHRAKFDTADRLAYLGDLIHSMGQVTTTTSTSGQSNLT